MKETTKDSLINQLFSENERLNFIIDDLQYRIDKANYILNQILIITDKDHEGQYRPVKNTTRREVYKAIVMLNEILKTPRRTNYELLGDKE